ncbi:MAG: hypothetical protein ACR2O6_06085, partial [Ilumatobacteraceae bacterium]
HEVDVEPVEAGTAGVVAREADVVLVEALAVDPERAIVPIGSSTIAAAAAAWGTPVWLVAGVGRMLPVPIVASMVERVERQSAESDPWDLDVEVLPTAMVSHVVGPSGIVPIGPPAITPDCSLAPELLRASPM